MFGRRHRKSGKCTSAESLESREMLAPVVVDFHNHFFAHFGEDGDAWSSALPKSERAANLKKVLEASNLNTSLPEFVTFSEHAGWATYNHRAAVVDLETQLQTALSARGRGSPAYGASVGIELTANDSRNPHIGFPFLDVNSVSSTYYNSTQSFGLEKLGLLAGLPSQQGLMVLNHPVATKLRNGGKLNSKTVGEYLSFLDNYYTGLRTAAVRASLAAIEFPAYKKTDKAPKDPSQYSFKQKFTFAEELMVSAITDNFRLTPTIGSDSHTVFKTVNGKTTVVSLPTPFVEDAVVERDAIGILDTLSAVTGLVDESSVKEALASRRGAVVYQRDATIKVTGGLSGTNIVREGAKVSTLPTTLTVTTAGFSAGTVARVDARYVSRAKFSSSEFLAKNVASVINTKTTTADSAKTSFTFTNDNAADIAVIYFVAYDSDNAPIAITAPIIATGSSASFNAVASTAPKDILNVDSPQIALTLIGRAGQRGEVLAVYPMVVRSTVRRGYDSPPWVSGVRYSIKVRGETLAQPGNTDEFFADFGNPLSVLPSFDEIS